MELRITLNQSTLRKMKALDALQGEEDKTDFNQMIAEYIDLAVTERIVRLLGVPSAVQTGLYAPRSEFEAAEGLSSEQLPPMSDDDEGDNPFAPPTTGKVGRLSFSDIERDSQVEDPEHEAVSPDNEEVTFGEALGAPGIDDAVADVPVFSEIPIIPPGKAPRSNPKPLPKSVKAKVRNYTGNEGEDL